MIGAGTRSSCDPAAPDLWLFVRCFATLAWRQVHVRGGHTRARRGEQRRREVLEPLCDRTARPLGGHCHVEHLVLQVREEEEQCVGLGRHVVRAAIGQVQPQLAAVLLAPAAVEVEDGREDVTLPSHYRHITVTLPLHLLR